MSVIGKLAWEVVFGRLSDDASDTGMTRLLPPENAVEIYRGVSKTIFLRVIRRGLDGSETSVDLTGASVYFTVKREERDAFPVVKKSSASSSQIEITDLRGGVAAIKLLPGDSKDLDVGQYVFDVLVILANGERHVVILPSIFEVRAGVSIVP